MTALEQLMDSHAKALTRPGENDLPVWLLESEDNNRILVATPFDGDESKEEVAGMMTQLFKEKGIVRYAYSMGMWFATYQDGDPRVPPRDRHDRREGVIIHGEDRNGEKLTWMFEIKRVGDTKVYERYEDGVPGLSFGRFIDMFGGTTQ